MNDEVLYSQISALPFNLKNELIDYMEFLISKYTPKDEKLHPKAGCMKGMFVMSDDFNDELDCFKEYVQ
jgi:hypothetical protein